MFSRSFVKYYKVATNISFNCGQRSAINVLLNNET
jgi:hypothetical protein